MHGLAGSGLTVFPEADQLVCSRNFMGWRVLIIPKPGIDKFLRVVVLHPGIAPLGNGPTWSNKT